MTDKKIPWSYDSDDEEFTTEDAWKVALTIVVFVCGIGAVLFFIALVLYNLNKDF